MKLSNPNQLDMFARRDQLVWAAGFVDGEGCVSIGRSRVKRNPNWWAYQLAFIVAQTKREPLDVLVSLFGGRVKPIKRGERPYFEWRLHSTNAYSALKELLPYLIVKRQVAEIGIRFQEHTIAGRQKYARFQGYPEEFMVERDMFYLQARIANVRYGTNPDAPSYEELSQINKGVNGSELLQ